MRHLPCKCKHYFTSRPNYGQKKLWVTLGGLPDPYPGLSNAPQPGLGAK